MDQTPLTPNELRVLEFLRGFIDKKGYSPSYDEIKEKFDFASYFSVQRYLKQLETKGYVRSPWGNKKRALEVVETSAASMNALSIPFLGRVAAGRPIEALTHPDTIDVPLRMAKRPHETFALKVEGDSMIDDGIQDGDVLVIQRQPTASNGQTVVALVENEATVKRFYLKGHEVELRPANPYMKPMYFPAQEVRIAGIVVGLLRDFK